jgi:hypothetical protein
MRVLNTEIPVDLPRLYPPAVSWFASLTDTSLVPGHAVFELFAGCDNAPGVPLCTFNVRHFRAAAGLVTEQPLQCI